MHRTFWSKGLTLPFDDKFWNDHQPSDHWNCKCYLSQTDEPATEKSDVPPITKEMEPQAGLKGNPGKTKEMFSQNHPYFPKNCSVCPFHNGAKDKVSLAIDATAQPHCANGSYCRYIVSYVNYDSKNMTEEQFKKRLMWLRYGNDKSWSIEKAYPETEGFIANEKGAESADEHKNNVISVTPLAKDGHQVELLNIKKVKTADGKKDVSTRDANIDGEKWELKFTKDYQSISSTISTKAGQAIEQGANFVLIDIRKKNDSYSDEGLIEGAKKSFHYNPKLKGICLMFSSNKYHIFERKEYSKGKLADNIKKWLNDI